MNNLPDNVLAHWEHFARVDIAPGAPFEQRHEMQRAFLAGPCSGVVLSINATRTNSGSFTESLRAMAALIDEAAACDDARRVALKARGK